MGDENLPHDFIRIDKGFGKTCIICSANEVTDKYSPWPPEFQRMQNLTTAARIKNFTTRLAEEVNPITDPHANFVQFLKDIAYDSLYGKAFESINYHIMVW